MEIDRNTFIEDGWVLESIKDLSLCTGFDCDNNDLNEYFHEDVKWHKEELLTQTYRLYKNTQPNLIVALLDFCNDTVRIGDINPPLNINPRIPYHSLPAVKLTRLGVAKQFQGAHIGTKTLNIVKRFFTTDNRTGCRYITVDAYPKVVGFYKKNDFLLFTDNDRRKLSRSMYFDLAWLKEYMDKNPKERGDL